MQLINTYFDYFKKISNFILNFIRQTSFGENWRDVIVWVLSRVQSFTEMRLKLITAEILVLSKSSASIYNSKTLN